MSLAGHLKLVSEASRSKVQSPTHGTLIDCYINQASVVSKHRFYVGYPESGKTTVVLHATIYAASRGLNILTNALVRLRAEELSGNHIHDIFCLPLSSAHSVGVIVERSLQKLYNRPEKNCFFEEN